MFKMTSYPRKIMVFDERIKSYDECIFQIKPKQSFCFYCFLLAIIKYKVFNHAFLHTLQICDNCAGIYYGGTIPLNGTELIPHDPLLDYLNEIDPIP